MAKRALVVGVNDYSNWSAPVTISGSTFTAPSLRFCVADAKEFAATLQDGFLFDCTGHKRTTAPTRRFHMSASHTKTHPSQLLTVLVTAIASKRNEFRG